MTLNDRNGNARFGSDFPVRLFFKNQQQHLLFHYRQTGYFTVDDVEDFYHSTKIITIKESGLRLKNAICS